MVHPVKIPFLAELVPRVPWAFSVMMRILSSCCCKATARSSKSWFLTYVGYRIGIHFGQLPPSVVNHTILN